MDEPERELWCRAWRLVVRHGDTISDYIEREMARLLRGGNAQTIDEWRHIASAVEHLSD